MTRLLHLSDTHFGTEQPEVVAALLSLAAELRPEVAVLSGDVTQRARPAQFAAAGAFMNQLSASVKLVIPGNHDLPLFNLWARLWHPYRGFQRAFGSLAPSYASDRLLVLCVNTTRAWRHQAGVLSGQQIEQVAARLRQARSQQLRVVVTHQPLAIITAKDRKNLLHGHQQAVQVWAQAGADLVLGGHIHLPYVRALGEAGEFSAPPPHELPHPPPATLASDPGLWVVQAGTAVSHRLRGRAPNSVHVIDWDEEPGGDVCRVVQFDFQRGSGRFEPVHEVAKRPGRVPPGTGAPLRVFNGPCPTPS
jgi:3',5'-cyclic AMP phosphodiesterase CpdA